MDVVEVRYFAQVGRNHISVLYRKVFRVRLPALHALVLTSSFTPWFRKKIMMDAVVLRYFFMVEPKGVVRIHNVLNAILASS
jgi:hypothetical protein